MGPLGPANTAPLPHPAGAGHDAVRWCPGGYDAVMDPLVLAKSAFALFAIVDPVGVIPIFLLATRGYT